MKRLCAQELEQLAKKLVQGDTVNVQETIDFVTQRIKEDL
jgi:hypothetical protein